MSALFSSTRTRLGALVALSTLLSSLSGAQDLVALARKEKERRAKVAKPVQVLTEEDGKEATAKGAGSVTPLGAAATTSASPAPLGSSPSNPEAQRTAWKARATSARNAVEAAEAKLAKMQSELERYRSDMTVVSAADAQDPLRRQKREARIAEMNKEIEVQKLAIADAKKALVAFEEEARRSGVPAGWLR